MRRGHHHLAAGQRGRGGLAAHRHSISSRPSPGPERPNEWKRVLPPRTWPTCWNTSFGRQPLPKLSWYLIESSARFRGLNSLCEALARLPPLPCGEPAGDSGDLDDRLGGGLAAVTPQTAHHPGTLPSGRQKTASVLAPKPQNPMLNAIVRKYNKLIQEMMLRQQTIRSPIHQITGKEAILNPMGVGGKVRIT